jgi:hypothetical protein
LLALLGRQVRVSGVAIERGAREFVVAAVGVVEVALYEPVIHPLLAGRRADHDDGRCVRIAKAEARQLEPERESDHALDVGVGLDSHQPVVAGLVIDRRGRVHDLADAVLRTLEVAGGGAALRIGGERIELRLDRRDPRVDLTLDRSRGLMRRLEDELRGAELAALAHRIRTQARRRPADRAPDRRDR